METRFFLANDAQSHPRYVHPRSNRNPKQFAINAPESSLDQYVLLSNAAMKKSKQHKVI
jgi:hypothetical protein